MADVRRAMEALANGQVLESKRVDFKEEAGRRGKDGALLPGMPRNEAAARSLAGEAACMANTDGGGAIIIGVDDKSGAIVGTELEPEWLRARIYDHTDRRVTPFVEVDTSLGARLIVMLITPSMEPVPFDKGYRWRVDDRCVPVDPTTILAGKAHLDVTDVSARPTARTIAEVKPEAMRIARQMLGLGTSGSDEDVLRRLQAIDADGHLTFAGELLFVGRPEPMLDYMRRRAAGQRAIERQRNRDLSLLEVLRDVDEAVHDLSQVQDVVLSGLQRVELPRLPRAAVREAIINGLAHRDWMSPEPTVVDATRDTVVVMSPGGFVGGVTPANIITHPSRTRNRLLADMLGALAVAEREGIGVDVMTRELVGLGLPAPVIGEIQGPYVRVALLGGTPELEWWEFLDSLEPRGVPDDLDIVLALDQLSRVGWTDAELAAGVMQKQPTEAAQVLTTLESTVTRRGAPVVRRVATVADGLPPVWTLSPLARRALPNRAAQAFAADRRSGHALRLVRHRGRFGRAELAEITNVQPPSVNAALKELIEAGEIEPSNPSGRGRGLYYRPTEKARD